MINGNHYIHPKMALKRKVCMFTGKIIPTHITKFKFMVTPFFEVENSCDMSHFDICVVIISFMTVIKSKFTENMWPSILTKN